MVFRPFPSARGTFWLSLLGVGLCVGLPELQLGQRLAPGSSIAASLTREAVWWGWGAAQLILVAFGAVIFAGLYLWQRDLVCNMIAHVLADGVAFLTA